MGKPGGCGRGATRRPQLVVVTWLDIQSDPRWTDESPSKATPARCITAGFLVYKDDKKIVLADSKAQDGDWGGLHVFPAAVVVKITNLRRSPSGFFSK